jgi:hypothetical protein
MEPFYLLAYPAEYALGVLHHRISPHKVKDGNRMVDQ